MGKITYEPPTYTDIIPLFMNWIWAQRHYRNMHRIAQVERQEQCPDFNYTHTHTHTYRVTKRMDAYTYEPLIFGSDIHKL